MVKGLFQNLTSDLVVHITPNVAKVVMSNSKIAFFQPRNYHALYVTG